MLFLSVFWIHLAQFESEFYKTVVCIKWKILIRNFNHVHLSHIFLKQNISNIDDATQIYKKIINSTTKFSKHLKFLNYYKQLGRYIL